MIPRTAVVVLICNDENRPEMVLPDASSSLAERMGNIKMRSVVRLAGVHAASSSLARLCEPMMKSLVESYKESLGSDKRRALHQAKMMEFRGHGPDPAPDWIPRHAYRLFSEGLHVGDSFNPLLECLWLPWAQEVQYYHHRDVAMVCCLETSLKGHLLKDLANKTMSWAIPTGPVLEYMISRAPDGKIAEIGSGLGYWAAMLKKLGADLVAVDNFSEKNSPFPVYFPETISMDGEDFIKHGGANGRALFFCWPRKDDPLGKASLTEACKPRKTCLAEACLNVFHGDTVFFVGEKDDGCTFDMAAWMGDHRRTGWRLDEEMQIPCWPGIHDVFMCFVKRQVAVKASSGKKKKKAAKKAQKVEDLISLSETFSKQKEERDAAVAAYSCNLD